MELYPIRYKSPILDANGQIQDFHEVEVYPTSLTDRVIASQSPIEQERLVRKQLTYQRESVANFVGLEKDVEITSTTLHLAELALDLEARSFHTNYLKARYGEARSIYETDKKVLKGKRKYNRVEQWQKEKNTWEQIIDDAKILEGCIANIIVKDFFLTEGGIGQLEIAIEEIRESAPESIENIRKLLGFASESLGETRIIKDPSGFRYKTQDGQTITSQTDGVLKSITERAFDPQEKDPVSNGISEISQEILEFYWKNATSVLDKSEYPLISITYDILYSASDTFNPELFTLCMTWLNSKINSHKNRYSTEFNLFVDHCFQDFLKQTRTTLHSNLRFRPDISEEQKILEGIQTVQSFWVFTQNKKGVFVVSGDENRFKSLSDDEQRVLTQLIDHSAFTAYLMDSVTSNVSSFLPEHMINNRLLELNLLSAALRDYEEAGLLRHILNKDELIEEGNLTNLFGTKTNKMEPKNYIVRHKELQDQYKNIRDNYQYFIALNGDQFIAQYDEDLRINGVQSITFFSIHSRPQSHKVIIRTNEVSATFYISENGNLMHPSGKQTRLPLYVVNKITNIIFSRLEYITSGEAFRGQNENGDTIEREDKQARLILARRSHWRKLPGDRYTLESKTAKEHIQEVFEDYGISTWQEILRRRVKGTLSPQEVMTYVKTVLKPGAEPNIIKYEPNSKVATSQSNL